LQRGEFSNASSESLHLDMQGQILHGKKKFGMDNFCGARFENYSRTIFSQYAVQQHESSKANAGATSLLTQTFHRTYRRLRLPQNRAMTK
jgi:hypothetical protein